MTSKPQESNEYVSGDMRGAHLKLAQRHRKIIAGQLCGNTRFEAECSTPGVVTSVVITFTTGALLSKDSRITCVLPDHGWGFLAPTINAEMRLPAGHKPTTLSTIWIAPTRTLEFTLLNEEVAAATPVVIYIPGVTTPESATPAAEAIITAYEKLVVRNTVPPSTRGGQIIDGPTVFTIAAVQPGGLTGVRKWQPFSCCPSAISKTKLAFTVHGNVPANCKVVVALPSDGWDMDELPNVLLQTSEVRRVPLQATWLRSQHKLEINIGNWSLKERTAVTFTIMNVRNPAKEIVTSTTATVTTLTALGGVIDGPTKIDVACISELRDTDLDMVKSAFDAVDVEKVGFIEIDKLHQVFDLSGVVLTSELYDSLVIGNLPVNDVSSTAVTTVTRDQILNIFAIVYAPAYKYGQELRLSSGRGEVHRIVEWIRRGCDPNHKDGSGWTALHYAADYGRLESIDALVETVASVQGATCVHPRSAMTLDVNVRDVDGWTPLLCAAANGHVAVMEKLLALGADHTIASTEGRTALHWAATRGMEASVTALLMAGANPNAIDRIGWTAMHCAMLHGNNSSTDVLNKNGANSRCKDLLQHEPAWYSGAATV